MVVNLKRRELLLLAALAVPSTRLVAREFQLPPPPASPDVELQKLMAMKPLRTPSKLAEIRFEAMDPTPLFWLTAGIRQSDCPMLTAAVQTIQNEVVNLVLDLKAFYQRSRPHTLLPALEPAVEVPWHSSYPSGHATQAHVMAHVFAKVRPRATKSLFNLADRIGRNREIAGVHYPSDTVTGFALADQYWAARKTRWEGLNC